MSAIKKSFGVNLRIMRAFGLYPPENCGFLYRVYAYVLYFVLVVLLPVFVCLYLLLEDIELAQVAETMFLLAQLICFVPKFLPFLTNGDRIKRCVNFFEFPVFDVVKDEHQKILHGCVKLCRITTRIYATAVFGSLSSWSIKPLLGKDHPFPIVVWMPFNTTSGPVVHYCVYAYLVLGVTFSAYSSTLVDLLVGGLAYHAACQVKILKNNLQHLSEYADEDMATMVTYEPSTDANLKFKIIYQKIRQCVDHHDAILTFVKEFEDCFSQVAFSQFVGAILVICGSCWQLTMADPLSFNFLAMIIYLIVMLSEIFIYCVCGTMLYDESNTITDAIYMGKWYEYDIKSQKALVMFMERAKRPMVVTSGKILDLSLVTFATILRRSYSLLAVFNSYN